MKFKMLEHINAEYLRKYTSGNYGKDEKSLIEQYLNSNIFEEMKVPFFVPEKGTLSLSPFLNPYITNQIKG